MYFLYIFSNLTVLIDGDQDDSYWNFKHFLESASHPIYGRSEAYFSATVDLAKARRCFTLNEEPRNTLRRTHETVKLTIEPHFLGVRYFVVMGPTGTCVCTSLIKRCSSL